MWGLDSQNAIDLVRLFRLHLKKNFVRTHLRRGKVSRSSKNDGDEDRDGDAEAEGGGPRGH
jgi:hypothetical protein